MGDVTTKAGVYSFMGLFVYAMPAEALTPSPRGRGFPPLRTGIRLVETFSRVGPPKTGFGFRRSLRCGPLLLHVPSVKSRNPRSSVIQTIFGVQELVFGQIK